MTLKQPSCCARTNGRQKMKRLERAPPAYVAPRAVTVPLA